MSESDRAARRSGPDTRRHRRRSDRARFASGLSLALACAMVPIPARAQLALPQSAAATPIELGIDATFTIDLGTLTPRPVLEIEAVPDASHPDIELVGVEACCATLGITCS